MSRISAIIPWRGRDELAVTMARNRERLEAVGAEVIVVNGGGDADAVRRMARASGQTGVRLVDLRGMEPFNKSACLNAGARFAESETLFTLDSDVLIDTSFLEDALAAVAEGGCFVTVAERHESDPEAQSQRWDGASKLIAQRNVYTLVAENGREATYEYQDRRDGVRTGPGDVVVRRSDYLAVGGLNSELVGWGFEDYDFQIRLQFELGLERRMFGRLVHLSHAYGGGGNTLNVNKSLAMKNYARGDYMGSYEADAEEWASVDAERIC